MIFAGIAILLSSLFNYTLEENQKSDSASLKNIQGIVICGLTITRRVKTGSIWHTGWRPAWPASLP
jgi:hypothetical protein